MELATLVPGVRVNAITNDTPLGGSNSGKFQINLDGLQVTQNTADASFGQPRFSPDAISQFQIITNRFDATVGRSSGIAVNVQSKFGNNQMHGSLFSYFRNDAFNAGDPVLKAQNVANAAKIAAGNRNLHQPGTRPLRPAVRRNRRWANQARQPVVLRILRGRAPGRWPAGLALTSRRTDDRPSANNLGQRVPYPGRLSSQSERSYLCPRQWIHIQERQRSGRAVPPILAPPFWRQGTITPC